MNLKKGNRVKHIKKPEWGIGEVLENPSDGFVRVLFNQAGEKRLSTELQYLDFISLNVPSVIRSFLNEYPNGFYGEKFLRKERDYKLKAHLISIELLDKKIYEELIQQQNYSEICKRALQLCNKTNLIFPNEKMDLKDGLKNEISKREFSVSLYDLLYGLNDFKDRFEKFCDILKDINAARWTIATYFQFFRYPENYVFLKPYITQDIANLFNYDIYYDSKLNWRTYSKTLELVNYLKTKLIEFDLKPRDMIDVQSFMWCITPHY